MRERVPTLGGLSLLVHSSRLTVDLRDARNHARGAGPPTRRDDIPRRATAVFGHTGATTDASRCLPQRIPVLQSHSRGRPCDQPHPDVGWRQKARLVLVESARRYASAAQNTASAPDPRGCLSDQRGTRSPNAILPTAETRRDVGRTRCGVRRWRRWPAASAGRSTATIPAIARERKGRHRASRAAVRERGMRASPTEGIVASHSLPGENHVACRDVRSAGRPYVPLLSSREESKR
jgi:hypothetical protein